MRDYIIPAREAMKIAARNPHRAHPSPNHSAERLLPFATPAMKATFSLSSDLKFAVFGDCFARSIKNSLHKVGIEVISGQVNRGMPGSVSQQIPRFDIYNLEILLQELKILVGEAEFSYDASLVDIGEETVDLMIGSNFAHSRDLADRYRHVRISDYSAALDADVVVLVTGGVEQWFDLEKGIYINGFVTGPIVASCPNRFELHRIGVDHAVRVLQQIIDLICRHSRREPKFILTNSSASDAMTYIPNDILSEHVYSRSVQRVAVEKILLSNQSCAYMPSLETLFLSDRAYCYLNNNFNHTTQFFCDRIIAEMMRACGMTGSAQEALRVCGIAGSMVMNEWYEDARDLTHDLFSRIPPEGNYDRDMFTVLLNDVYTKLRMPEERARLHLRNADLRFVEGERSFSPDQSYSMALNSARSSADLELIRDILNARGGRALTEQMEIVFQDVQTRLARLSPESTG